MAQMCDYNFTTALLRLRVDSGLKRKSLVKTMVLVYLSLLNVRRTRTATCS